MAKERWKLTQSQWEKIEPLLPKPKESAYGGRPWADLPKQYPSPSTCWRRLKLWEQQDIWLDAWRKFLAELDQRGQLDWSEAFVDGSFAPAKKGANASAQPKGARARSGWWWSTAKVFLWETTWTLRPRRKSSCSKKR